ncbi:MAG: helix-turn-helix domain-containing protein [Proteobacteria bacterium]|nr:helix-turn-helix domain-containing protein [Pseudomonadota bacterium]
MKNSSTQLDFFIGKKIKLFRKKLKLPLKTLAANLNISLQQLHRYENGTNKVAASTLYEISKITLQPFYSFVEDWDDGHPIKENYNILLLEANIKDSDLIKKIFDDYKKVQTICINTAYKALAFIEKFMHNNQILNFMPNLIFLDLNILSMENFTILTKLREFSLLTGAHIIILADQKDNDALNKVQALHASGLIYKNSIFKDFQEQLHDILKYWIEFGGAA